MARAGDSRPIATAFFISLGGLSLRDNGSTTANFGWTPAARASPQCQAAAISSHDRITRAIDNGTAAPASVDIWFLMPSGYFVQLSQSCRLLFGIAAGTPFFYDRRAWRLQSRVLRVLNGFWFRATAIQRQQVTVTSSMPMPRNKEQLRSRLVSTGELGSL